MSLMDQLRAQQQACGNQGQCTCDWMIRSQIGCQCQANAMRREAERAQVEQSGRMFGNAYDQGFQAGYAAGFEAGRKAPR